VNNMEFEDGIKYDQDRLDWRLIPLECIEEIVKVLQHGAEKYSPDNWQRVRPTDRYYAALMRHVCAWRKGEIFDRDSKFRHLSHALTCLVFLLWFELHEVKNEE